MSTGKTIDQLAAEAAAPVAPAPINYPALRLKVRAAIGAVFEIEQELRRAGHFRQSATYDARHSLGHIEDVALRETGVRGG